MRFSTTTILFAIAISGGAAFAPSSLSNTKTTKIYSSVEVLVESESAPVEIVVADEQKQKEDFVGPVTAELINSRLEEELEKMRLKDQTSKQLTKEVRISYILYVISFYICYYHIHILICFVYIRMQFNNSIHLSLMMVFCCCMSYICHNIQYSYCNNC